MRRRREFYLDEFPEYLFQLFFGAHRMADTLFQDIFEIIGIDPAGKKFDRVNRIVAKSEAFNMEMQLDINTEIYPMRLGEKFMMELAPTLNLDGTPDTGYYIQGNKKSLADKYEYVMYGKLYRITEDKKEGKADILASFGGLLMLLKGDITVAAKFDLDQKLFLLIRKV